MSKNPEENNHTDQANEWVEKLIQAAHVDGPADVKRPSPDAIFAYLTHTATDEQRDEVQAALARSSAFRKELLELARSIANLSADDAQSIFDRARAREIPSHLVEQVGGLWPRESREPHGIREFLGRLMGPLWKPIAVAAVAVILILAIGIPLIQKDEEPLRLAVQGEVLAPETFRQRPPYDSSHHGDKSDRDAAIRSLTTRLKFVEGRLEIVPGEGPPAPPGPTREVEVILYDAGRHEIGHAAFRIPKGAADATAWIVLSVNRELIKEPLSKDRVEIQLPAGVSGAGVITVTYQADKKFASTNTVEFSIP